MGEPNSNHEKNAEPQDAASEQGKPQETPQGGGLPDVSKTVRDVRTLWEKAVPPDASPGASIKAGGIGAGLEAASKLLPRLRRLSKAKEEKEKPEESDFELIELLGKGGMGMVFLARQKSLDREVAVKVIQPQVAGDAEARGKFFAEALVTGELDHPNIVPVYDFGGTPEGVLFYPMKQVRGTSWDKVIQKKSLEENLSTLNSVCDAVAFAHDKGVIHRDLKPENVMLGDYGEVFVMDWGLAASVGMEKAEKLTPETGSAGTPAYMAPEMAKCEPTKIGPASDIYLLGGILYEIVTGLRPHTGDDVYSCIHAAMENVIQPTDKKGELVEIALKAMATEPQERHKSVKNFQRVVREYRSHAESLKLSAAAEERLSAVKEKPKTEVYRECTETIAGYQQAIELWSSNQAAILGLRKARETFVEVALERGDLALAQSQVSAMEEECRKFILPEKRLESPKALADKVSLAIARAARKEKIARLTRRAALAAASLVLIVSLAAYFITKAQRNRALTAEKRAIAARAKEAEQRKRAERENYYNIIALADAKAADLHFDQAEALLWTAPADLRGWEWGRLMRVCHPELLTLFRTALVPSAKSVGTEVTCAAFSPDGARVVVGSSDGVARILDAKSGQELATLVSTDETRLTSVGLSPDWKRAFTINATGTAEVWDAESRHKIFTFHGRGPDEVAFSPDGTRLAGIQQLAYVRGGWKKGPDDTVKLWDAQTGAEIATLEPRSTHSVAFSMNGRRLATEGYRRDPTTNAVVWEAKLWDALTGAEVATVPCGTPGVRMATLALSMEGKRIATRPNDGTTTVWDAQTGGQIATYRGRSPLLDCLTFSPDGRRVLSKGLSGLQAEIWDAETGQEVLTLKGLSQVIGPLCVFSPNGKLVLTVGPNSVKLWDAQRGGEPLTVVGPSLAFSSAQLSADGKRVLTTHGDGLARLWDAETGAECLVLGVKVRREDFSPDGSLVVTRDADGTISVREAEAGGEIRSLQVDSLRSVEADLEKYGQPAYAFSPDGKRIAAETKDESLDIWDAETRRVVFTIPDVGLRPWLAFSPDGRRLAAGGGQSSKQPMNVYLPGRIWDAQTGRQILTFGDGSHELGRIQFSPDGRRVAAWGG